MTVREIAEENGYSKSTVHKDLNDHLPEIDIELYRKVRHVLDYHTSVRQIRGGRALAEKKKNEGV